VGILDAFSRAAEGPPPSSNWAQYVSSGLKVNGSQQLVPNDAGDNGAYWLDPRDADVDAGITLVTLGAAGVETEVLVRTDPASLNGYAVHHTVGTPDTIAILRYAGGTPTTLGGGPWNQDLSNGDKIGIRASGTLLQVYARISGTWTFIGQATDATYAGGSPTDKAAVYSFGSTAPVYDDFFAEPGGPGGGGGGAAHSRSMVGAGR